MSATNFATKTSASFAFAAHPKVAAPEKATSSLMWTTWKKYLMLFLGRAMGLGDLPDGIRSEIMSWGGYGLGTLNDPKWGPGDKIALDLVGSRNGCMN